MVMAVQVVTIEKDLDSFESGEADPMVWLPVPAPGVVSLVTVCVLALETAPDLTKEWPGKEFGTLPFGTIITQSRGAIVVHGRYPLTSETSAMIEDSRWRISANAPSNFTPQPGMRAVVFGSHETGMRLLVDLAYVTRRP
jgi:hypothetical protein